MRNIIFYKIYVFLLFFSDMSILVMADWVLFIWLDRHFMDIFMADVISGNELPR